ncbi:MAG: DUF460 domain-containing protein [Nanobdellota archaeon]
MKPPIIVGIDPGTTTAVAILSIHKELLLLDSQRKKGLNALITQVIEHGIPLIVGCDKKDVPEFVNKFAIKTGARLKSPPHDLLVREKRALVGDAHVENDHEMDALASAYYAFRQIQSQLTKILRQTTEPEIITLVIKHDFSIHQAKHIVTQPEKPETKVIHEVVHTPQKEPSLRDLYEQIRDLKLQNTALQKRLAKTKEEADTQRKITNHLQQKDKGVEIQKKERSIKTLKNSNQRLKKEKQKRKANYDKLMEVLIQSRGRVLVKVLEDLSSKELQKKSFLCIGKGDVLYVRNPKIISKTTKDALETREVTVIAPSKPDLRAVYISESTVDFLNDHPYFLLLEKGDFKKALGKHNLLQQIVDDYRRTR